MSENAVYQPFWSSDSHELSYAIIMGYYSKKRQTESTLSACGTKKVPRVHLSDQLNDPGDENQNYSDELLLHFFLNLIKYQRERYIGTLTQPYRWKFAVHYNN